LEQTPVTDRPKADEDLLDPAAESVSPIWPKPSAQGVQIAGKLCVMGAQIRLGLFGQDTRQGDAQPLARQAFGGLGPLHFLSKG